MLRLFKLARVLRIMRSLAEVVRVPGLASKKVIYNGNRLLAHVKFAQEIRVSRRTWLFCFGLMLLRYLESSYVGHLTEN